MVGEKTRLSQLYDGLQICLFHKIPKSGLQEDFYNQVNFNTVKPQYKDHTFSKRVTS